ncbi:MAG: MBL fold metallo-hydrolase [Rikenellaceae bacterium]
MNIAVLVFNPVQENTYILWDETSECVIIDAGNFGANEDSALENFITSKGLKPVMAINTHGHFDHTMGVEFVKSRYNVPFAVSSQDNYLFEAMPEGTNVYGFTLGKMPKGGDIDLDTTEELKFGNTTLQVIKTPGHTPGQVSLYEPQNKVLFTGDTLFKESIGRTDLPGGDYPQLMDSILNKIVPLGDEVTVYPGHSSSTTIGHETLYNPFVVEVIQGQIKY